MSYGYDNNGNRTSVTTPNGTTSYSYDQRNRLRTATVGDEETEYSYRADGMKESVSYSNGTESGYSYFSSNRIKGISNKSGTAPFSSYSYQYDANGNRTRQVELQNGLTWTTTYGGLDEKGQPVIGYDTLDRLVNFTVSAGVRTTRTEYGYEGYNRKTENVANIVPVKTIVDGQEVISYEKAVQNDKVYSYDSLNRLTGVVDRVPNRTVAYAYDANGNTVKKTDSNYTPAYADTFFDYDALNRLVQAKQGTMQGGNLLGLYDYDANNMRIRHRNSDRGDVDYYYDGNSVIEERNSTDDSLLARYSYADKLLALATAEGSQYYHQDALGSTVNLTDGTGAVKAGYVLDPWGHVVQQEGESVNRQIFTGQEQDPNTGLVYFGQRYYDPDTGRFINQDSYLGEQGTPPSLHRYLYAYSNPTVYIDLEGYEAEKSFWEKATDAYDSAKDKYNKVVNKIGGLVSEARKSKTGNFAAYAAKEAGDEDPEIARSNARAMDDLPQKQTTEAVRGAAETVVVMAGTKGSGKILDGVIGGVVKLGDKGKKLLSIEDVSGKVGKKLKEIEEGVGRLVKKGREVIQGSGGAGKVYEIPASELKAGKPYIGKTRRAVPKRMADADHRKKTPTGKPPQADTLAENLTTEEAAGLEALLAQERGIENLSNAIPPLNPNLQKNKARIEAGKKLLEKYRVEGGGQ